MPSTRRSSNVTPSRRNTVVANPVPAPTPTRRTTTRAAATRAAINIDMQMGSSDDEDDEESPSSDEGHDEEGEDDGATSEAQEPEDEDEDEEKQPAVAHLKVPAAGRLKRVLSSNASSEYNEAEGQRDEEAEDEEPDVQPRAGQRQSQRRAAVGRKRVVDDDDEDEDDDDDGEDEIEVEEEEAPTTRYSQKASKSRSAKPSASAKKAAPKTKPPPAPQATLPRIKLKLGGTGGPSAIPMSASTSNATSTSASSSTQRGKVAAQRRTISITQASRSYLFRGQGEDDEDEDEEDVVDEDVDVEGDGEGDEDGEEEEAEEVDVDVESEDESSEQEISEVRKTTARLTARQAILATTAPHLAPSASLISLDAGLPPSGKAGKKKHLTEMELALRREETARKRKNLSEKKLEDEKAETINRLLKKQSRPRARRQNTDTSLPGSSTPAGRSGGARTPRVPAGPTRLKSSTIAPRPASADGGEDVVVEDDGEEELVDVEDGDEEGEWEDEAVQEEVKPTMFRWVSRAVPVENPTAGASGPTAAEEGVNGMDVDGEMSTEGAKAKKPPVERKMVLSFAVPISLIPGSESKEGLSNPSGKGDAMDVDGAPAPPPASTLPTVPPPQPSRSNEPAVCAVAGCGAKRKYRLVKDWTVGACGMGHLKLLEAGT